MARPDEGLNPEAAELYDLVTSFGELTIHATYQVEVAARPDSSTTIEIWQKDGKVRQEATVEGGAGSGKVAMLDLGDRVVLCQEPPGGTYTCGLVSESETTAFDELRSSLVEGLAGQDVEVREGTIDGRDVRCFGIAAASTSNEVCVTDEGVLVRISSPEGTFKLLDVETEVDDAVFTPPAPPGVTSPA